MGIAPLTRHRSTFSASSKGLARHLWRGWGWVFSLHFHLAHHLAVEEVYYAVGIVGVVLGVGYHDDGGALLVQFAEQVHHLLAVLGVEVTRWLVGQDDLRT